MPWDSKENKSKTKCNDMETDYSFMDIDIWVQILNPNRDADKATENQQGGSKPDPIPLKNNRINTSIRANVIQ